MDQPKVDRLLRLMKILTGNTSGSVSDIALRFDMSERTIYRYIDTFREAGFVIKKKGDAFRIDKSSPYFRDISSLIHFTNEEAYILKSAIESIDETNLIKQNLKKKLYTVYNYKILAETVVKGKNATNVNLLVEAIENEKQVILRNYSSAHSHNIADRLVEPFAFTTNYIQIWAYEPESGENKLFKLSRVAEVQLLPDNWKYKQNHEAGFIDIFRIHSSATFHIRLQLGLMAATLLTEEYPLAERYLTRLSDNKWILETEICSMEGAGRFVTGLLHDIEILEPEAFREYVAMKLRSALHSLDKS